jgi:CBS domain-containing protein
MTVGNMCTRGVVTVRRDDGVLDAAVAMRDRHVGDVVVVDLKDSIEYPVGILTDRDIVVGIVAQAPDKIVDLRVADVLTTSVVSVTSDSSVEMALQMMRHLGIRRLPVVDVDGALVGIVTFDDLLGVIADELAGLAAIVERERFREEQVRV